MNETLNIEAKLIGSEETKRRRAELLADLSGALAEGGPQAVTGEMTRHGYVGGGIRRPAQGPQEDTLTKRTIMFTLNRLMVEGFRGFREAEEFTFNQPATELFGDNRSGKSSTLNAIEWGFFGDGCAGKQTGIRERVGWIVPNQNTPAPAVRVELELEGPEGTYVIVRMLRRPPKKTALEETLELTFPDGTTETGDAAKTKLAGLLQSSFRDFLTTVYQHQEAIRTVLTQEPKNRNDAIDRLLGLSDQRNLLSALDGADLRASQKQIGKDFSAFEEQVQAGLVARENDLSVLRQEAQEAGITRNQMHGKAAVRAASNCAKQ